MERRRYGVAEAEGAMVDGSIAEAVGVGGAELTAELEFDSSGVVVLLVIVLVGAGMNSLVSLADCCCRSGDVASDENERTELREPHNSE